MTQQRLKRAMLLSIHTESTDKSNFIDIANKFVKKMTKTFLVYSVKKN